jgi:hypothetical protein
MNEIIISVNNWGRVSDADVLRVVRAAINNSIKYESDRTLNRHHYWHAPDKRVELQITYK